MRTVFVLLNIIFYSSILFGQTDSLVFQNGDIMVGDIKSMDRGILQIETDYSDSDFKVEWDQIFAIKTNTFFFINLSDGRRYFGSIESSKTPKIRITTIDKQIVELNYDNIVQLQELKKGFWDRLYASIDVGLSLTRANNLRQFNSRSTIGYRAEKWSTDASFNTLNSTQTDVEPIERSEGKIDYRQILPGRWYSIASISLASNTEQKLDLRVNAQLGFGIFLLRTNSAYWGVNLGANRNIERYSSETEDRNSWEGNLSTELNLYDIGDFSLLTQINAYPGITDRERFRADFTLDTKYDLPFDFYIKIGLTVNYDNKPAEGASETDYVFQTGFGWEW